MIEIIPKIPRLYGVAKKAWENTNAQKINSHEIVRVSGTSASSPSKMIIVHNEWKPSKSEEPGKRKISIQPTSTSLYLVAFPRPSHFRNFENGMLETREFGPADYNPQAIGSMSFTHFIDSDHLVLKVAHSHYVVGDTPTTLPRSLSKKYGGWRVHCLKTALELARKNGLKGLKIIGTYQKVNHGETFSLSQQFVREVNKVAEELGASVRKEGTHTR